MDKKTQCKKILAYMTIYDNISTWDAMETLHIARLASRIHDLKRQGYNIADRWEKNEHGKRIIPYQERSGNYNNILLY